MTTHQMIKNRHQGDLMTTSIEPLLFRNVLGHFPTGVTVVAAADGSGAPVGLTIGSFFSVSLDPPLVGFCVGKSSSTWPIIRESGAFCANVLAGDQGEICAQLSRSAPDKFAGV